MADLDLSLELLDPIEMFRTYFAERGISPDVIDLNGIQLKTFEAVQEFSPPLPLLKGRSGFLAYIPFHDIDRQPIAYHVARVLQLRHQAGSFAEQLGLDTAKLVCPVGPPKPYFPLHNPEIGPGVTCVITESAIKALVLANCGYYAIGLNGCWGFTAKASNTKLLPELIAVPWKAFKRIVFLPDSDYQTNPHVRASASRLHTDMKAICRVDVNVIELPMGPSGKWGIDDYYAAHGEAGVQALVNGEASEPDLSEYFLAMNAMNENVIYVKAHNAFALLDQNVLAKDSHFHNLYAPLTYMADDKPRQASMAWVKWQHRNEVDTVISRPGWPITDHSTYYNLWRPNDLEPVEGDVSVHLKFLRAAIPVESERKFVQQWIAHTVQRPDNKKTTALVFFSEEQGTGKTMLAETLGLLIGTHNTAHVSMDVIRSQFTSSYVGRQLCIINETHPTDAAHADSVMDKLKTMISDKIVQWHAKGRDPIDMENFTNFIFTTNHANALRIDPSDRRFAVIRFLSQFRYSDLAEAWGEECWNWHMGHAAELLHYYLNFDLSDYRAGAPAPMTEAKIIVAEAGLTEMELIARSFAYDPSDALQTYGLAKDIEYLTADQIIRAVFPGEVKNLNSLCVRLGLAMAKFGLQSQKANVSTPKGRKTVKVFDLLQRPHGTMDTLTVARDYMRVVEKY